MAESVAQFRLPWLFFKRRFELSLEQATSGWQLNLRICNVVPEDSSVFVYAKDGDTSGLRELFRSGQASPFDRDQYDRPTLWVRISHGRPKLTIFFIHINSRIEAESNAKSPVCLFYWTSQCCQRAA